MNIETSFFAFRAIHCYNFNSGLKFTVKTVFSAMAPLQQQAVAAASAPVLTL